MGMTLNRLPALDGSGTASSTWSPPAPLQAGPIIRLSEVAPERSCPGRLPEVRGLMFDMGGVLYDDTVWRRWLLQLLGRLGLHTTYRCFFRIWERDYLSEVYCGRRELCEAFEAFLLAVGLSRGQIDEIEAACQGRRRDLETNARPLPGVKATLGRLYDAGLALGIVTNSERSAAQLEDRLEQLGIGRLFGAIVSSIDLERTLPDRTCYEVALAALKLSANEVAFVGHDTAELAGASAAGMRTIAVNYDLDAKADVLLTRFDELDEVVCREPSLAAAG